MKKCMYCCVDENGDPSRDQEAFLNKEFSAGIFGQIRISSLFDCANPDSPRLCVGVGIDNNVADFDVKINYCPKCGRDLRGK